MKQLACVHYSEISMYYVSKALSQHLLEKASLIKIIPFKKETRLNPTNKAKL